MRKSIFRPARVGLLSLGLALGATGPAAAQTDTPGGGTGGTMSNAPRSTGTDTRDDRGFNPGWLGLLGLAGLIPLFTRKDNPHRNRTLAGAAGRGSHA